MKRLEVLVSCMNQKDFGIVESMNIQSDAIIVNQCDHDSIEEKMYPFGKVLMINSRERGLSNSRNMALKYSTSEICLICDDDEVLKNNYAQKIIDSFNEIDADVIVYNVKSKNIERKPQEELFSKIKKIPYYKSYSSVHIAFKRISIINNNIVFDTDFGTGSGLYSMAEDSLFFRDIHKHKLKAYVYPEVIADLYTGQSSWFEGYNKKYFYDVGAYLAAGHPRLKHIFKWYYPIRLISKSELSIFTIIKCINMGIKNYEYKIPYSKLNDDRG